MSPPPHDLKEMTRLDLRVAELQNELQLLLKQQAGTHKQLIEDNDSLRKALREMWLLIHGDDEYAGAAEEILRGVGFSP